jgi:outer membrane protein, multidrug efflux system
MSKEILWLGAAAQVILFLSGCAAFAPEYREPAIALPTNFSSQAAELKNSAVSPTAWWESFGDESLNALATTALRNNRDLRASIARLNAARARRGAAVQDYLPTGGPDISRSRRRLSDHEGGGRSDSYRVAFDSSWELDLFGRVASAVQAADARTGAAHASVEDLRLTVVAEVARIYFEWRGAQRRIMVLGAFHADQASIVDLMAIRVENDINSAEDLNRAQAQLASDRAALLAEQQTEQQLRHTLAVLVGEMPGTWQGPAYTELQPVEIRAVAIGDPAMLLRQRPDVRSAERRLAAATYDIGVATADLFPQIRVTGALGFVAGDAGDIGQSGSSSWLLAPSLAWGLFDLGRVKARIRVQESETEAALVEYEQVVLRAMADAENAFASYSWSHERLSALAKQSTHARQAAELARIRYEEGETDYLGALDAKRNARAAESELIDGMVQQRIATLAVHKALGVMPSS